MSVLVDRFLNDAPLDLRREFAFACADRAVRVYAVDALRSAGFEDEAMWVERLASVTSRETAHKAARVTADAARSADDTDSPVPTRLAVSATRAASSASSDAAAINGAYSYAPAASRNAANAASYAASVPINKVAYADRAAAAERRAQDEWIRAHWEGASPITPATLADLDAYIADGFLLSED